MTIELVDTIEVVADTARLTFGAGGDGELGTALDGDADEFYILEGLWVPHVNNGTILDLEFNGINTATSSQAYTIVSGGPMSAFRRRPGIFLCMTQMAAQPIANFTASIWPITGYQERTMFVRGVSMSGSQLPSIQRSGGQWQHNTANITSLVINCPTAAGIRAGSRFRLFKRTTPSIAYPTTLSEIGTMMGYQDPNHGWRLDNVVSVPDFGGGAALGPVGTPTVIASLSGGVRIDVSSTDQMIAGDAATMDVATGDFMVLAVFTWQSFAVNQFFYSKYDGEGNPSAGFHLLRSVNDGQLQALIDDGASTTVTSALSTYRDGLPVIAAYGRRSGIPFLVTDREALVVGGSTPGSLSNPHPFQLGYSASSYTQGLTGYLNAGWNATLTSEVTQANLQALKAAMGL